MKNSTAKCIGHPGHAAEHSCRTRNTIRRMYPSRIGENPMIVRTKLMSNGWTCSSSRVDFRIPGIPHSTVEKVETNRKEKVRRLIEQFENHPNWNMLLMDYKKSEEMNHVSRESKDLITEMGNTEIFEFYETSSKRQCSDCALYWRIVIVYCTCGNARSLRRCIDFTTKTDLTHCRFQDT